MHLKLSVVRVDAASFFGAKSHGGGRKNEPTAHSEVPCWESDNFSFIYTDLNTF